MRNHYALLYRYVDIIRDMEMLQSWIDAARVACAANQHVQLELDRTQSELDERRTKTEAAMYAIASSN